MRAIAKAIIDHLSITAIIGLFFLWTFSIWVTYGLRGVVLLFCAIYIYRHLNWWLITKLDKALAKEEQHDESN